MSSLEGVPEKHRCVFNLDLSYGLLSTDWLPTLNTSTRNMPQPCGLNRFFSHDGQVRMAMKTWILVCWPTGTWIVRLNTHRSELKCDASFTCKSKSSPAAFWGSQKRRRVDEAHGTDQKWGFRRQSEAAAISEVC